MLSAQVFLRLGNHAGKYLPFFHPPWFIPSPCVPSLQDDVLSMGKSTPILVSAESSKSAAGSGLDVVQMHQH